MYVECIVVVVEQVQAFLDIDKSYAPSLLVGLIGLRVAAGESQSVANSHLDLDERLMLIADAMLEGILDERDKHQGRNLLVGHFAGQVDINAHLVGIAQAHQRDVVADEVELTRQGHPFLVTFVKDEAHHLRQFQDGRLGFLCIDVNQRMDVVQRVHEEMGVNLIFQILQLLFQALLLQMDKFLLVVARLEIQLDAKVHAQHQDEHDDAEHIVPAQHHGTLVGHSPVVVPLVHK